MSEEAAGKVRRLTRWKRIAIAGAILVAIAVAGAGVFILSGIYNIGASRDHWSFTNFAITILRDRSISVASGGIEVPDLEDPDLFLLGAEHYRGGCSTCHGTPGQTLNPIYANMLPQPPDLFGAFDDYGPREVFWIVQNGLKYTGMPAWPGEHRSEEVWSVVAYLNRLHSRQAEPVTDTSDLALTLPENLAGVSTAPLENCIRCHGDAEADPVSALVPHLQGLSEAYLERALLAYREGLRESGIMEPVAHDMTYSEITSFAAYYASLPPAEPDSRAAAELIEHGRLIAEIGVPADGVPACNSCHNGLDANIPALAAQSERYMTNQLQLWRQTDYRSHTGYAELMSLVAKRLDASEAAAVSAYYASLPPTGGIAP